MKPFRVFRVFRGSFINPGIAKKHNKSRHEAAFIMPALFRIPLLYALRGSSAVRAGYAVALIRVIGAGRHLHRRRRWRRHESGLAFRFDLFEQIRQFIQIIGSNGPVLHFL